MLNIWPRKREKSLRLCFVIRTKSLTEQFKRFDSGMREMSPGSIVEEAALSPSRRDGRPRSPRPVTEKIRKGGGMTSDRSRPRWAFYRDVSERAGPARTPRSPVECGRSSSASDVDSGGWSAHVPTIRIY